MVEYIFVLAAFIAVTGILIVFKINVEKIKENPETIQIAQRNLFIGSAISETIPIILIVYGFATVETVENISVPFMLVILILAFSLFFIFLQSKVDVDENNRGPVQQFSRISMALVSAIPIIAIVFFLTFSS